LMTLRSMLKDEISQLEPNVEVIGDRALLRFFRGHLKNMDTAVKYIRKYYNWRKENNVDQIRRNIVHGGMNCPTKFPNGGKILDIIPQVVCSAKHCDKDGAPVSLLSTNFSPAAAFEVVTMEEYIEFIMYTLEYQQLVLEQLSEKKERERLEHAKTNNVQMDEPYGVILQQCVVRDLGELTLEHLGTKGQQISRTVINISSDNYPEMLKKMYIVKAPWIFSTFFWGIKQILPARTIAKISVQGHYNYQDELHSDIDPAHLPPRLGGNNEAADEHETFHFDVTDGGLLHCPDFAKMC